MDEEMVDAVPMDEEEEAVEAATRREPRFQFFRPTPVARAHGEEPEETATKDVPPREFVTSGPPEGLDADKWEAALAENKRRALRFGVPMTEPDPKQVYTHAELCSVKYRNPAAGTFPFTQEEREKADMRALKFGTVPAVDNDDDDDDDGFEMELSPAEQRREVHRDTPRRTEALHIFGVDKLATADILVYFQNFGPDYVEWLNDSSCNVCFPDAAAAERALEGLSKPGEEEAITNDMLPWKIGRFFKKNKKKYSVVLRPCTTEDAKSDQDKTGHHSRYYKDKIAKMRGLPYTTRAGKKKKKQQQRRKAGGKASKMEEEINEEEAERRRRRAIRFGLAPPPTATAQTKVAE